MADPLVIRVMREFKRALLARERAQVSRLVRAWMRLDRALAADIESLVAEIAALRAAGEEIAPARLYSLGRYQRLLAQVQAEILRYEREAEGIIVAGQEAMARQGVADAQDAIRATYQTFGVRGLFYRLPVSAVEYMVGATGDDGPLFGVLQQRALTPAAVEGLTNALVDATARGWNPRRTARAMQTGLTDGLQKALVIARTEQLRVYRMASDEQYRSSRVVRDKVRVAAKDSRTCLACLAMDGEVITLDRPMYDHPQGRCTAAPRVVGLPDVQWQKGPEWFASLGADRQLAMMGAQRYEAWSAGGIDFRAFATQTDDPVWGQSLQVTPLARLLVA
jgi:SPP1 gp7 family putative phage head morphogenesis protein